MKYDVVIGLEVHAELSTKTKIYCSCENTFGAEVNTKCCPICSGMPGTLPTLNKKVVEYAVRAGHAFHCHINTVSKQDRKNYFYPDLPKAYQISQFDIPLCEHGYLDVILNENGDQKRIGITRIHIEEDAGKLLHNESFAGSLADYNRCGVPLIEIVSEPDMRSSDEAKAYLEALKATLQCIGVSDCKMQEGSLRCDVNVSIMPAGSEKFGTRCEMKNVNSFSGAVHAIEYEIKRQAQILDAGGVVEQETRRWDEAKGMSFLLRSKEDAQDYRYFPEPDLTTIVLDEKEVEKIKASLPELPHHQILRYMKDYSLPLFDANLLSENPDKAQLFEDCVAKSTCQPKNLSNWILGDVSRILNERNQTLADTLLTAEKLCDMVALIEKGTISNTAGKSVIEEIMFKDTAADAVVKEKGLAQISDTSALEAIVRTVLEANPKTIEDYKNGKTNVIGFLVGQCMRASKGQGNPKILQEIILKMINNH